MRLRLPVLLLATLACTACPRRGMTPVDPTAGREAPPGPVPIEIPQREGPPVVVLAQTPRRAPLFHHELHRLELWAARHLALQNEVLVAPVPSDQVQALRARLGQHQLTEKGPRCLAQPPLDAAVSLAFPDAWRARVIVECEEAPCRLRVELDAPDGTPAGTWSAKVEGRGTFEDWEHAAQELAPSGRHAATVNESGEQAVDAPGEELIRGARSGRRMQEQEEDLPLVSVTHLTTAGAWSGKPALGALVAPRLEALRECHTRGQQPTRASLIVLELDAAGAVRTCEGYSWREPPLPEPVTCFCAALDDVTVKKGAEGRRLALEVTERGESDFEVSAYERVVSRIEDFRSSDPGIDAHWLHSALPWVSMCYAQTRLGDTLELKARFVLDARGAVTEASIDGADRSELFAACAPGYLRNVVFPCPVGGSAELEFTVRIQRERERENERERDPGRDRERPERPAPQDSDDTSEPLSRR